MNLIQSSKKALRKVVASTVRAIPVSEVQNQSDVILKLVLASPVFQHSKSIGCYLSVKGEVDTSGIVRSILQAGKLLYVPKMLSHKDSRMDFLKIYNVEDLESLPSGMWGIKEPTFEWSGGRRATILEDNAEFLDLIIVPGVAFDNSLSRLGHGKGYYDIFISTYFEKLVGAKSQQPKLIALSLREQILPFGEIPMAEHDRRMDVIITPDGVVEATPGGGSCPEVISGPI